MSKNKGQLTIRLEPGEACVIMDTKYWDHMVQVYSIMASDAEDLEERADWEYVIQQVKTWVERTIQSDGLDDYDED